MASYVNLSEEYDALETRVHRALRMLINDSKTESKHRDTKALTVSIFDAVELVVKDENELVFLDENGYEYSLYCDCTLVDLIDIVNQNK